MPKRGGATVSGCRGGLIAPQPGACRARRVGAGVIIGIVVVFAASPASAYRPFDGTDAAVADLGEAEIEFQPIGAIRAGPTKPVSDAILNFGFADRWELVLQGTAQPLPEGVGPISVANAAFLKYVVQPGVLQDKSGPSIATEFGPLLPAAGGGSGVGFGLTGIVSQRWDLGTVHLNVASNLTPDQHGELFFDAIIEGPNKWKVRPVFEIYSDSVVTQSQTFSGLVGAIWQVNDKLSFDAAVRYASVDGRPVSELRLGMTFGFPLVLNKPMSAESPFAAARIASGFRRHFTDIPCPCSKVIVPNGGRAVRTDRRARALRGFHGAIIASGGLRPGVGGGAAFLCQATWPSHNRPASVQKRCGSLDLHQRHRMVAS